MDTDLTEGEYEGGDPVRDVMGYVVKLQEFGECARHHIYFGICDRTSVRGKLPGHAQRSAGQRR